MRKAESGESESVMESISTVTQWLKCHGAFFLLTEISLTFVPLVNIMEVIFVLQYEPKSVPLQDCGKKRGHFQQPHRNLQYRPKERKS